MILPESFCERTRHLLGEHRWTLMERALREPSPTSIRLHPVKAAGRSLFADLRDGQVAWCEEGYYLRERPAFTFDPLLHGGAYYVQEASSMFVSHVVRQLITHPVEVLDMCAAPGGKSTAMLSALPSGSLLYSNEPIRNRANILAENLAKYGHRDVVATNNYPKDYRRSGLRFDLILTDVPCSGEGMFRKDEGAIGEWSLQHVRQCQQLQREIVECAWACLRDGGWLIYSTCTFNSEENEDNLRWIVEKLGGEPQEIGIAPDWGIQGAMVDGYDYPCYRFMPGLTKGEGLFMAVVRKKAGTHGQEMKPKEYTPRKKGRETRSTASEQQALEWLNHAEEYEARWMGDTLYALPKRWASRVCNSPLRIIQAGVAIGTTKGKDLVPDHRLALSMDVRTDAFAQVALDQDQAISYLRRMAMVIDNAPKGYVLFTYQGLPLGFAKNLGNRANNLYPNEWRIRSIR